MNEWTSVKDKKPLFGISNMCLFFNGKKEVTYGYAYPLDQGWDTGSDKSIWINDFDRQTNEVATHWMPLPEPPNERMDQLER